MSLAIATASREDRPSSTIAAESSIASADWPVALAIQLRSHSRISATVMSVRAGVTGRSGASLKPSASRVGALRIRFCVSHVRVAFGACQLESFSQLSAQSVSSGKALATFPLRRLPSR